MSTAEIRRNARQYERKKRIAGLASDGALTGLPRRRRPLPEHRSSKGTGDSRAPRRLAQNGPYSRTIGIRIPQRRRAACPGARRASAYAGPAGRQRPAALQGSSASRAGLLECAARDLSSAPSSVQQIIRDFKTRWISIVGDGQRGPERRLPRVPGLPGRPTQTFQPAPRAYSR